MIIFTCKLSLDSATSGFINNTYYNDNIFTPVWIFLIKGQLVLPFIMSRFAWLLIQWFDCACTMCACTMFACTALFK